MKQNQTDNISNLAERIRRSDREAFDMLFRRWYRQLVHYAESYVRDHSSACDIVQDSFLSLWKNRTAIDPEKSLKAYTYMIVKNRAISVIRRSHSEIPAEDVETKAEIHTQEDPKVQQADNELKQKFREWIDNLPERQQEAFELSRFEGLNHHEIADVMDVSPKTVNNHIVAALQQLRSDYSSYKKENQQYNA